MFRNLVVSVQRRLVRSSRHRSPDRIAWGIAVGAAAGLVPWHNLLAACLLLALLVAPVHRVLGASCYLLMAWVAPWIAPLADSVGSWILSQPATQSILAQVHAYPVVPWLRLNNTRVLGGFCLGIGSVLPCFLVLRWGAVRARNRMADWAVSQMADHAAEYRKSVAIASRWRHLHEAHREAQAKTHPKRCEADEARVPRKVDAATAPTNSAPDFTPSATTPAAATPAAAIPLDATPVAAPVVATTADATERPQATVGHARSRLDDACAIASESVVRETMIEIVRFRHAPHAPPTQDVKAPMILESAPVANDSPTSPSLPSSLSHDDSIPPVLQTYFDARHATVHAPRGSESLKYLLHFLSAQRSAERTSESRP